MWWTTGTSRGPSGSSRLAKQWTQASPDDFEKINKRVWRDKATGVEYRHTHGTPLLGIGTDATRFISAVFVLDGKLVFLERADGPKGTSSTMASLTARRSSTA